MNARKASTEMGRGRGNYPLPLHPIPKYKTPVVYTEELTHLSIAASLLFGGPLLFLQGFLLVSLSKTSRILFLSQPEVSCPRRFRSRLATLRPSGFSSDGEQSVRWQALEQISDMARVTGEKGIEGVV